MERQTQENMHSTTYGDITKNNEQFPHFSLRTEINSYLLRRFSINVFGINKYTSEFDGRHPVVRQYKCIYFTSYTTITFYFLSLYQYLNAAKLYHILSIDIRFNSGIIHIAIVHTMGSHTVRTLKAFNPYMLT